MPLTLDLFRLVEMAHELASMGTRGVRTKRLGLIALDILLSKAAASQIAEKAPVSDERERAQRALEFLNRLEAEVVRMYATTLASRRLGRRLQMGIAFAAIFR
jgi:hypothetical protein